MLGIVYYDVDVCALANKVYVAVKGYDIIPVVDIILGRKDT